MALVEEEYGGGYGRPVRNKEDKSGGKKAGLSKWDKAAQAVPEPGAPGHLAPTPSRAASSRFDRQNLTKLTPFAMPVSAPVTTRTETAKEKGADETRSPYASFANAFGGGPARSEVEAKQRDQAKIDVATGEQPGKPKTRRSYQMTWEEYNALSDEARAAVDFNTLLIQAREKDLNTEYQASPSQRKKYDAEVAEMFGEERGSETYAPETLSVLKQIDFKSDGEDLDDFLGLKVAIGENDLKNFSLEKQYTPPEQASPNAEVQAAVSPYGAGGLESDQRAAVYTTALQESMAKAGELLQNFRASAAEDRNDFVLALGGTLNDVRYAPGYGDRPASADEGNIHSFFQDTFAALTNKSGDPVEAWNTAVTTARLTDKEQQLLLRYIDEQTSNATDFELKLGKDRRDPAEIRKIFGLDKGA